MAGYLFGRRVGAVAYNACHMFAWPLALLAVGLAADTSVITTAALSWIGHIGFDHAMGYGVKLPTSLRTHGTRPDRASTPEDANHKINCSGELRRTCLPFSTLHVRPRNLSVFAVSKL